MSDYYVAGAGRVCVNSGVCKCANSHRSKQTRKAQPKSLGVRSGVCSPVWSVSRYARALFCRKLILMGPRSPGVPRGVSGVSGPSRLSGPSRPNVRMLTSHRLSSGVRVSFFCRKFSHLGPLGTPWDPLGPPLTPIDPWDPCYPLGPLCDPLGPL